ncbi:hypothetical protein Tco_0583526 [Tanacetum coccineum]
MAPNRRSGPSSSDDNENPDVATVIAQQLQAIITQVANNANNANNGNNGGGNGNDGNNGCFVSYHRIIEKTNQIVDYYLVLVHPWAPCCLY